MNAEKSWEPRGWKRAVRVEVLEARELKTRVLVLEGRRKGQTPIVANDELSNVI